MLHCQLSLSFCQHCCNVILSNEYSQPHLGGISINSENVLNPEGKGLADVYEYMCIFIPKELRFVKRTLGQCLFVLDYFINVSIIIICK